METTMRNMIIVKADATIIHGISKGTFLLLQFYNISAIPMIFYTKLKVNVKC
jgi:hypothetical protein